MVHCSKLRRATRLLHAHSALIVRRGLLKRHGSRAVVLQSGKAISENLIALLRSIKFLLLPYENVTHVLERALKVSEAALKIVKPFGLSHGVGLFHMQLRKLEVLMAERIRSGAQASQRAGGMLAAPTRSHRLSDRSGRHD